MKKRNIANLVRYHMENNDNSFRKEVTMIADEFEQAGDTMFAQYLLDMVSYAGFYVPQGSYENLNYLDRREYSTKPLYLPDAIEEDILGIARAITKHNGMSKFLFYGKPGTGKTEAAYQIARLAERDILAVNMEKLIDSRLGESSKNIVKLFEEIGKIDLYRVIIMFDELDSLVLNRVDSNDLREMGRVTSTFLRELDKVHPDAVIIATTNLIDHFDKALIRRFDATVSFDRYAKDDLLKISEELLRLELKKSNTAAHDIRLFRKILNQLDTIPYPGDMKQFIRTAIAFSDESEKYDYLRRLYLTLHQNPQKLEIHELSEAGFTTREIEVLTHIPKSSVSRKLKENI